MTAEKSKRAAYTLECKLIFHSDRGSQYCSHTFQQTLVEYGMQSSMSRKERANRKLVWVIEGGTVVRHAV